MTLKKYRWLVFTCFILSIFIFGKANATVEELPLLGRIVYIDPGHGGHGVSQNRETCINANKYNEKRHIERCTFYCEN